MISGEDKAWLVLALFICLTFGGLFYGLFRWGMNGNNNHQVHLEQHRQALEMCLNAVETEMAKVECFDKSKFGVGY